MHTKIYADGRISVETPLSRAGDQIVLQALMDVTLGVAACSVSESRCNGGKCLPVQIVVESNLNTFELEVVLMKEKKPMLKQEDIMELLDKLYDGAINGIPKVSPPISQLVQDYISKADDTESAAKSFINCQIVKCTTSGFLSGLGGIVTLPVTIPANIGSVLYVQMRMIACLAQMGGFDTSSDQVQTLVYACLAGISLDHVFKQIGMKIGMKVADQMVKKIPGTVLTKINQRVGFRLLTKFGSKGVINIGKAIPVVGGVIGGGFDFVETKFIANRAYQMFILGNFSEPNEKPIETELIEE